MPHFDVKCVLCTAGHLRIHWQGLKLFGQHLIQLATTPRMYRHITRNLQIQLFLQKHISASSGKTATHHLLYTAIDRTAKCSDHLYEELRPLPLQAIIIAQFPDCPDHIICHLHALLDLPVLPRLLRLWVGLRHDGGRVGAVPLLSCGTAL